MPTESPKTGIIETIRGSLEKAIGLLSGLAVLLLALTGGGLNSLPPYRSAFLTILVCEGLFIFWGINNIRSNNSKLKILMLPNRRSRLLVRLRMIGIGVTIIVSVIVFSIIIIKNITNLSNEFKDIPAMTCSTSDEASSTKVTILIGQFNQTRNPTSIIEDRIFDLLVANQTQDFVICLVDRTISNEASAKRLLRDADANAIIWGRIDSAFEVKVNLNDSVEAPQLITPTASSQLTDVNFELSSPKQISIVAQYIISQMLYRQNKLSEALNYLEAALNKTNLNSETYNTEVLIEPYSFLGTLFAESGNNLKFDQQKRKVFYDKAIDYFTAVIEHYKKTIASDPNSQPDLSYYRAYFNRAFTYNNLAHIEETNLMSNKLLSEALSDYVFLVLNPSAFTPQAHIALGQYLIERQPDNCVLAEKQFKSALLLEPTAANYKTIGMLQYNMCDDFKEAIDSLQQALKTLNSDPELYNTLGLAQLKDQQFDIAQSTYADGMKYFSKDYKDEIKEDLGDLLEDTPPPELKKAVENIELLLNG